jgi:hypothetical protein
MAIPNKFQHFVNDYVTGVINFSTDTFKLVLTNTLPVATQYHYSNLVGEVANGNGYTTGGLTISGVAQTYSAGVMTVTANPVTVTASGGSIGPFEYYIYIDATTGTNIVWYDYGVPLTLASTQFIVLSPIANILFTES